MRIEVCGARKCEKIVCKVGTEWRDEGEKETFLREKKDVTKRVHPPV